MSKQFEIARVRDIPQVYINDPDNPFELSHTSKRLAKVVLDKKTLEAYHDALNPDISFWYRFKQFLKAENEAGRIAKAIKDFALIFLPFGEQVDDLTDFVQTRILTNKDNDMKTKLKRTSKTIIIFGLLFLAGLLQTFGMDLGLELSPDAEWVLIGSGVVGIILRLVTKKPVNWGKFLQLLTGKNKA